MAVEEVKLDFLITHSALHKPVPGEQQPGHRQTKAIHPEMYQLQKLFNAIAIEALS